MANIVQLGLGVLAAGFMLYAAPSQGGEMSGADISGKWRINRELSDDPREVMQKNMEALREGRGGGPKGGRGGPGGGGRGGRGGGFGGGPAGGRGPRGNGGAGREQMQERLRQLENSPRDMVILQEGDDVTMIHPNGDTLTVCADGKKRTHQMMLGEVEIHARWVDLALEVKTRRSSGSEKIRLYRISSEGRLEVVHLLRPPRASETIEIVTVYDEIKDE
jgi:hypothetical protein